MKIIKNTFWWLLISTSFVVMAVVLALVTRLETGSFFRYGIDFTGGSRIEIALQDTTKTLTQVQDSLKKYEELTPSIQPANNGIYIIKMKSVSNEKHEEILKSMKETLGELTENQFSTTGPAVGESMKNKAWTAIAVTLAVIVLYIAFAFREIPRELSAWKFGFAALFALAHDVVITIGFFSLFGFLFHAEVDTLFITALLTVLGFSIHDTIVVFDRIRENARYASPKESFADITEKSVLQTMRRSINTSFCTILPLIALYFLGAESIKIFVLTLIVGITVGTYSSIFLASPVMVLWNKLGKK